MPRVDYDKIAHLYDEPCRDHAVDPNLKAYLADHPAIDRESLKVLDVGCGTGKQLTADREVLPDAILVGLDRFRGMLGVARDRCSSVRWINGDGACLPFASRSFHYVTNQFSYQHVQDKAGLFQDLYRVIVPGGRFVMTNIDPWAMPNWIIYRYFPAALALDHEDFLSGDRFTENLRAVGLTDIQVSRKDIPTRQSLREFQIYASQRHHASELMAIADEDYRAGIDRIEQELALAGEENPSVESELCVITITGDRPS